MKNIQTLALALATLTLGSCIITIDDTGASWGYSSFHDSYGSGPRHKGSGHMGEVELAVADFEAVRLRGSFDLNVRVEPGPVELMVSGDDNLLQYVRSEVRDGVLIIDMESGSYSMKHPLIVHAATPNLRSVMLDGSGEVRVHGVEGPHFKVQLSGSGDISVAGRVGELKAGLSGSGDLDLANLEADEVSVQLSGSGDVRVFATERLAIDISGSGEVGYRGNPKVDARISGSGDVYAFD